MITKQTYDIYRRSEEMPIFIIHDYYIEHKNPEKRTMTIDEFSHFFPEFMMRYQNYELFLSDGSRKFIDFSLVAYIVLRYYEEYFYPDEIVYNVEIKDIPGISSDSSS